MKVHTRGFTLIEILVVIAIMAIMGGLVGLAVLRHPGEAKVSAAQLQIKTFKQALQLYKMEQGGYPTQEQGLEALCLKPVLAPVPERYPDEGYLNSRKLPKDPWNRDYLFLLPGRRGEPYEILSYGADGLEGGEKDSADLSSSDL